MATEQSTQEPTTTTESANGAESTEPTSTNIESEGQGSEPQGLSFKSQDQLNERLDRHFKSQLKKELGVDNPSELKDMIQSYSDLKQQEEQRQREQMSEQEKLQSDLNAAQQRAEALEAERDQIRLEAHVKGTCAQLGITNIDYAMYEISKAVDNTPDGKQVDIQELLQERLQNESARAALGIKTQVQSQPANTSPDRVNESKPNPETQKSNHPDVKKMSKADFNKHLSKYGVGLMG